MTDPIDQIIAGMSEAQKRAWLHEHFNPVGWEPGDPTGLSVKNLIDLGLCTLGNARCGFELLRDAWLTPTPLGLAVRAILKESSQ